MKKYDANAFSRAFVAFAICLAFLLMYVLLGNVNYMTDDDRALNLIAAGAYDPDLSAYLIFQNIVYGYLLKALYHIFPRCNMYLALMLALNFLSVFTASWVVGDLLLGTGKALTRSEERRSGTFECVVMAFSAIAVNMVLCENFYNNLQFTQNAGLYTAVGCMLFMVWSFEGASLKHLAWIPSIFFMMMGYCVRRDSYLAVLGIALIGLFALAVIKRGSILTFFRFRLSEKVSPPDGARAEWSLKGFAIASILAVVSIAIPAVLHHAAYATEDWQYYLKYHECVSRVLDFYFPGYNDNLEAMRSQGIEELDMRLLREWMYADPDNFTLERMEWLKALSESQLNTSLRLDEAVFVSAARAIQGRLFQKKVCMLWLALLVYLILRRRSGLLLAHLLLSIGIIAEYYYLSCRNRIMWRMEILPWVAALAILVGIARIAGKPVLPGSPSRRFTAALLAVSVGLFCMELYHSCDNLIHNKDGVFFPRNEKRMDMVGELKDRSQHFYIWTPSIRFLPPSIFDIDTRYADEYANTYPTGGWTIPSPLHKRKLERYGVDNPFKALVQNDGEVFLIDNSGSQEQIRTYLEKEIKRRVAVTEVEQLDGWRIWKFRILGNQLNRH